MTGRRGRRGGRDSEGGESLFLHLSLSLLPLARAPLLLLLLMLMLILILMLLMLPSLSPQQTLSKGSLSSFPPSTPP